MIEARAHAVQRRGDVFAHGGPIRARAVEGDLMRRWKQPLALAANDLHHALGDCSLKQLHQRVDLASALPLDLRPRLVGQWLALDLHHVQICAADERTNPAGLDL